MPSIARTYPHFIVYMVFIDTVIPSSLSFHSVLPTYLLALFLFLAPLGLPSDLVLAEPGPALAAVVAGALALDGGGTALAGLTANRLDFRSFFLPHECIAWMIRLPTEPEMTRKAHLGMRETTL
jgi:hypothetical protein